MKAMGEDSGSYALPKELASHRTIKLSGVVKKGLPVNFINDLNGLTRHPHNFATLTLF
jgi:hypothetical protein